MTFACRLVENRLDYALCAYLRAIVFVHEQGCPLESEFDSYEDTARHWAGMNDNTLYGSGRWRLTNDGLAKIERVVVRADQRGKGYGRAIMNALMDDIRKQAPSSRIVLSSQDTAIPFYEKLGFKIEGDGYIEDTIPCHYMILVS
jgi:predicted GNAT family N-acyltransferase